MDARAIADLLVRCQAGDKAAWETLVEAYWQRLFGYALRATNNAELAQDLVQETFLRIVQRLGRYDDQGKFEAWLFRILVNLVRDHGRSLARHPTQSTVIESDGERIELTDELSGKVRHRISRCITGKRLMRCSWRCESFPKGIGRFCCLGILPICPLRTSPGR